MTELQEIGLEVGIPADMVAAAARSVERAPGAKISRFLGLPIGVRDAIELDRRLSDAQWDQMVVAARDTFGARGAIRDDGEFREWTNGNLAMLLEPSPTGHRIRSLFLGSGLVLAGGAVLRLPGWAKRRREQMKQLAAKAQAMTAEPADDPLENGPAR